MSDKLKEYLAKINEMMASLPQEDEDHLKFSKRWQKLCGQVNEVDPLFLDINKELLGEVREELEKIRNLTAVKNNSSMNILINKALLMLAKLIPRNEMTLDDYPKWICPITFNVSYECNSIALTSGYLYDQKALFKWFSTSKQFKDPITREELSSFDVSRIMKREQGLAFIQKMRLAHEKNVNELLAEQYHRFDKLLLDPDEEIKKQFLLMTSSRISKELREREKQNLLDYIRVIGVVQEEQKYTSNVQLIANFSKLNLSGLYFYQNTWDHIDLRGADLSNCIFLGSTSTGECMHGDLTEANLENAKFLNLPGEGTCIKTTSFRYANLKHADFTGVGNWSQVNLDHADLSGAFLYNAKGIKLTGEALKKYLKKHDALNTETAIFTEETSALEKEPLLTNNAGPSTSSASQPPRLSVMPRGLLFEQPRSPDVGTSAPVYHHQSREEDHPRHCCLLS